MTTMTILIIIITVFVFGVSFVMGGVFKGISKNPSFSHVDGSDFLDEDELKIIKLTNLYRTAEDLGTLKVDLELNISAENRVKAMIFDGRLSHRGFAKMSNDMLVLGLKAVSENVGFGFNTPEVVVDAWFKSAEHRSNIKGNWTYTGVSIYIDSKTRKKYYCQIFAR